MPIYLYIWRRRASIMPPALSYLKSRSIALCCYARARLCVCVRSFVCNWKQSILNSFRCKFTVSVPITMASQGHWIYFNYNFKTIEIQISTNTHNIKLNKMAWHRMEWNEKNQKHPIGREWRQSPNEIIYFHCNRWESKINFRKYLKQRKSNEYRLQIEFENALRHTHTHTAPRKDWLAIQISNWFTHSKTEFCLETLKR